MVEMCGVDVCGDGGVVAWDAVILAGGRAERLGADKATLIGKDGRSCLQWVMDACSGADQVVVVGPDSVADGAGRVRLTREVPAFSGPARGICAGVGALGDDAGQWVVVVACDMPNVAEGIRQLLSSMCGVGLDVDGVVGVSEGRRQWLCSAFRTHSLRMACERLGTGTGESIRYLVRDLVVVEVEMAAHVVADIDTQADMRAMGFCIERRSYVGV